MKKYLIQYLNIRDFYIFIFLSSSAVLLSFGFNYVNFKEAVYLNSYEDVVGKEAVDELFKNIKIFQPLVYIAVPIFLIIKVVYNSVFITIATLLKENMKVSFGNNYSICLRSELVFVVMLYFKLFFSLVFKQIKSVYDLQYIPFSLLDIYQFKNLPGWSFPLFNGCNLWEVLFCFFGMMLFSTFYKASRWESFKFFCIPYLIGLIIYLFIYSFLIFQFI